MSSTPLSNGLGESGQNPLSRNVAHCTSALLLTFNNQMRWQHPLSNIINGLGESGQSPLGRNATGCSGCSNKQTLYKHGKRLGSDIKPLLHQHVMPPLGCIKTSAALRASWQQSTLTCNSARMKRYTASCEFHKRCPTSRCLARHCLQFEKHRFNEGIE